MEDCAKHIKHCRPKLSESSTKTYCNILRNLYRDLWDTEFHYEPLIKEQEKVMKHLEGVKYNVRKTILSALVAISDGKVQAKYRDLMIEDARKYNSLQKENKMTDVQKENWITWKEVEEHVANLKKKFYYVFKESKPTRDDILNLQKYVMACCYTMIPPRRSMDFTKMMCRSYDKTKDNFYEKGTFVFHQYKTAKFSGMQMEKVPQTLKSLLDKWIKFIDNDHLFSDYYGKELTSAGISKILNSCFGKKQISVNQLRHIYITEKSAPLMKELEKTAEAMGHSTSTQKLYVKNEKK